MRLLFPLLSFAALSFAQSSLRPPAVPLVTHDPYFSVWSGSDALTGSATRHWTGTDQPLSGLARIDGKTYRYLGDQPRSAEAMKQIRREVTPTRTHYHFEAGGVQVCLVFLTPALPHDLEILSRPVTYVTLEALSTDGATHDVSLYFDASAVLATNTAEQKTVWSHVKVGGGVEAVRAGMERPEMLSRSGDNLRIEWGHVYLALPPQSGGELAVHPRARAEFVRTGQLPEADELEPPARVGREQPQLAAAWRLTGVGKNPVVKWAMLAYDDQFSIQYLQRNLRPYWRRNGMGVAEMLQAAAREYPALAQKTAAFDKELTADLVQAGGAKFADIAVLAYRQALAAHKLVADLDGTPLYFSKENFSNGCIATVDVTYPSAPMFLLLNPKLLKGMLQPMMEYASLPRWRFPFAPHDLGQYPLANGQVYGGGEKTEENQMPVEESGNLLILTAALAEAEGNADFARKYWPVLGKWAEYLREKGMDPDNQLSTDDFAGHLAHNTNLSIKAIVALGSYAQLAEKLGYSGVAAQYRDAARQMARRWPEMAKDGDHYRLAFDKPGTWSQKYNLVWDHLLGLNLFEPEIARTEVAYYLTKQNKYGLPLDNRQTYTKLDWIIWTATLAERKADFEALVEPVWAFLNESPSRVPMSDWYWTLDGKQRGFQARSVVGGVYLPALKDRAMWKKWRSR
ncbi:MAG: DUF4965 domain-containing protein [Acidobacteria bacterium]|nr:DUF4965 domain-containing protein [Acidobacteriota bacterium]